MIRYSTAFICLTASIFALDSKPWIGTPYEFVFDGAFSYSRFHEVENASVQLSSPSNTYDLMLDLGVALNEDFDVQGEVELAQTTGQDFTLRSAAVQGRYQCFNDICGDPVSLTFGFNFRAVPTYSLQNVSCPYSANSNFELTAAIGREWSKNALWKMRTYGLVTAGMANRGYPWTRELLVWQNNFQDIHRLTFFAEGLFGFGPKQHVNTRHFHGWAPFHHQSIDLGLGYGVRMGVWGTLSLAYAYRVFARNFPERVNSITLEYRVPFSIL